MDKQEILAVIKRHIEEVIPGIDLGRITLETSLRDLGANSIDRADILIMTMERLRLKFPLTELAGAKNLQGLVDCFARKLAGPDSG
ncbi:MAG: acyl carrier protein [Verrucomicrobia bacterium]|nr:acyl carrier protein [Verrucomicrobiota bacterium]